jgi:hypothetical protein
MSEVYKLEEAMFRILHVCLVVLTVIYALSGSSLAGPTDDPKEKPLPDAEKVYLVLRLVSTDDEEERGPTCALFCEYAGNKMTVEQILTNGLYFRNISKLIAYATERDLIDRLEYDAIERLSDGPGLFKNFESTERKVDPRIHLIYPDLLVPDGQGSKFIARMKVGEGGFVFNSPSGVPAEEGWVLSTGAFVKDCEEFIMAYNKRCNEPLIESKFSGVALK